MLEHQGKCFFWQVVCCAAFFLGVFSFVKAECSDTDCSGNGVCKNETCVCFDGWQGPQCQFCGGKVRPEHIHHLLLSNEIKEAPEPIKCKTACSDYNSCLNCTQEECVWCQNEGKCVDKNAYTASFSYGQCRERIITDSKCRSRNSDEESQCSFYTTCAVCREDPVCGWCDDRTKTGLGKCMPGGYAGPILRTESLPLSTCPPDRWHFTTCPLCQCNGHAGCEDNSSVCLPCSNFTTGNQCEDCISGYWGNPANGEKCQPCECNGQATECDLETGNCYCSTKGVIGDHCDKCDEANYYKPDPINNKTLCYYNLTTDFQFVFNMSKKEHQHYTQINFFNSPFDADSDVDFSITCSVPARMNITFRKATSEEEIPIYEEYNCTSFSTTFLKSDYSFGFEESHALTTFYVYVYEFQTPIWVRIAFFQYSIPHNVKLINLN